MAHLDSNTYSNSNSPESLSSTSHLNMESLTVSSQHHPAVDDCGDFETFLPYEVDNSVEDPELYAHGSYTYYPARIGDELAGGDYRIEHKLGHGGFSTVWLAYATKTKKRVALKIMVSGDEGDKAGQNEIDLQKAISDKVRNSEGASSILTCIRTFSIAGDPGTGLSHHVLVFPLQGPSLRSWPSRSTKHKLTHLQLRMLAAWQLLKALECLHDGDYVHCDLNDNNVMWGIDNEGLDSSSKAALYKLVGRPKKSLIPGPPMEDAQEAKAKELSDPDVAQGGKHEGCEYLTWRKGGGERVRPMQVGDSLIRESVYLSDFGLSMKVGPDMHGALQWPIVYCAPERLHNQNPSFYSDMWSYMCIFARLFLGFNPFSGSSSAEYLEDIANRLGPLPEDWRVRYVDTDTESCGDDLYSIEIESWYDPSRECVPGMTLGDIVERVHKRGEFDKANENRALSIMLKGFSYRPKDRFTAKQLLQNDEFIALMNSCKVNMSQGP